MYAIDHLMFEVDDPQEAYEEFNEVFGLPNAWPYVSGYNYDSIGLNFGAFNVEFIRFRIRFGESVLVQKNKIGGIAFRADQDLKTELENLRNNNIAFEIGEDIAMHTTVPLNKSRHEVTPFVVSYKFNTEGWRKRTQEEFFAADGGKLKIGKSCKVILNNEYKMYDKIVSGVQFEDGKYPLTIALCSRLSCKPNDFEYLGANFHFCDD